METQYYSLLDNPIVLDMIRWVIKSTITLGNLFDFLFLLEGVGRLHVSLLDVDDLVGEDLSNGLE